MFKISQISYYYSFRFPNHCNHYTCFQILCNQQSPRKSVKKKKKNYTLEPLEHLLHLFFFLRQNLSSACLEYFNLIILTVVVTILYIRSSDFMHLITKYWFTTLSLLSLSPGPGNHHSTVSMCLNS